MRERELWGAGWKFTAARRMKGVVRPHARPTRRKPSVQLRMEGEGAGVRVGSSEEVVVDMVGREEGGVKRRIGWSDGVLVLMIRYLRGCSAPIRLLARSAGGCKLSRARK